jgi:hypothetical protein
MAAPSEHVLGEAGDREMLYLTGRRRSINAEAVAHIGNAEVVGCSAGTPHFRSI